MADNVDIPAVGEYKRLGVIGVNVQMDDSHDSICAELGQDIKLLRQIGDIKYYLVESELFALLSCPAVIPFYSIFYPPFEVRGVWATIPFIVAWDKDGVRIVENPPDN